MHEDNKYISINIYKIFSLRARLSNFGVDVKSLDKWLSNFDVYISTDPFILAFPKGTKFYAKEHNEFYERDKQREYYEKEYNVRIIYACSIFDKYIGKLIHLCNVLMYKSPEKFSKMSLLECNEGELKTDNPDFENYSLDKPKDSIFKIKKEILEYRMGEKLPKEKKALPMNVNQLKVLLGSIEAQKEFDISSMRENEVMKKLYTDRIESCGSIKKAAESLGIAYTTFRDRLKRDNPELLSQKQKNKE